MQLPSVMAHAGTKLLHSAPQCLRDRPAGSQGFEIASAPTLTPLFAKMNLG